MSYEINFNEIPFLKRNFNSHISEKKLLLLPLQLRNIWYRLDLDWLDEEILKSTRKNITQITEKPVNVFDLIKKDKQIKIKAMVLGELSD